MEDLTGYYLESVQGLTTLKLFHQDERRTEVLQDKADRFNNKIMDVMRVNFTSFLFTDGMIYGCVVLAAVTAFCQLAAGSISFSAALMALMLSYSFRAGRCGRGGKSGAASLHRHQPSLESGSAGRKRALSGHPPGACFLCL